MEHLWMLFILIYALLKGTREGMKKAALKGFINATDCADYLVKKGLPFREAYKITGEIVAYCIEKEKTLEDLLIEEYQQFNSNFDKDIYDAIDLIRSTSDFSLTI